MPNLLQKASIVLTPTAYNDGEVLCAKPDDGSGDFDFSRNSAATRVNAQGLVENVQILSSNLVQNGDFSEEGVQEVSNGSFSQEGSELITNGDFSNGSTGWQNTFGGEWVISGGKATLQVGADGSYLSAVGNILTTGKSYKAVITTSGGLDANNKVTIYANSNTGKSIEADGTHTLYFTANGTVFRFSGVANDNPISIESVSVREVGQDWTIENTWTIGDGVANGNGANGTSEEFKQNVSTVSGKTYALRYEIKNYVSGSVKTRRPASSYQSGNGIYTELVLAEGTSLLFTGSNFNGSITNISVKEVLQDWSVEDYGAVSPSAVITPNTEGVKLEKTVSADWRSSFLVQPISYTNGSQYKVTFKLKNGNLPSGGSVFVRRAYDSSSQNIASTLTLTNDWVEYTYYFVADSNSEDISFGEVNWQNAGVGQYFYIDDVSVIEITDDTNLPRINYEGFSYQDALGSEEVVNGTFDTDLNNWVTYGGTLISWESGGYALLDSDGGYWCKIKQSNVFEIGKTYKVTLTAKSNRTGLNFHASPITGSFSQADTFETFDQYYTATSTSFAFGYANVGSATITIDNVSVKEYLGQEVVPNSGCGSWLWEPQSTNLLPYSEDYTQWSYGNVSIESGYLSPDGTNNATKVTATTPISKNGYVVFASTSSPTTTRTIYARTTSGTGDIQLLSHNTNTNNVFTVTEQWQRFEVNSTSSITNNFYAVDFRSNLTTLDEVIIWAAQEEQQSYATSYIPTSGSSVTRNQDVCTNGGSLATINSTEGVLYAEIAALANDGTIREISINNGSIFNRVSIYYTASVIYAKWQGANGGIDLFHIIPEVTDFHKVAIKYKSGDTALWVDGLEVDTSSSVNSTSGLNVLDFDRADGANNFYGKTKAVAVWKEALSDEELAELTYPTPTDPTFTLDFDTIAEQFTFARGSEATYVDAQGLIQSTNEIGEELVVNGDFATDSDWNKVNATISDGKGNLDSTSGTSLLYQSALVVGKSYKATLEVSNYNGLGICALINSSGATQFAITSDGNKDFYFTHGGTNANLSFRATNGGIFSIDNVSVKEYITATNTPRLDYSTGAEAFLLEPQSTNLLPQSQDLNTGWATGNSSVVANSAISPDGTINAFKLVENTATASHNVYFNSPNTPTTNGVTYTMSFFAKAAERTRLRNTNAAESSQDVIYDLSSGTIVSEGANIIDSNIIDYGNGWYRCIMSFVSTTTIAQTNVGLMDGITQAYPGDGVSGAYLWGFQTEAQSYATSYIPTNGSQTTRNQETCINATPEINSEEGVLYAEISALADDGTYRLISLNDGTSANIVQMYYAPAANRITAEIKVGNVSQAGFNYTVSDTTDIHKIAFKYKENDFALWIDGVEVGTDASGAVLTAGTLTELDFSIGSGSFPFYGNTKDIQVYTKALSDAELIKLTT